MKQYYAVFDTNVLVSALLSHNSESPTVAVVDLILDKVIIPLYNEEILCEYNEVLGRAKFAFSQARIDAVLAAIQTTMLYDMKAAIAIAREVILDELKKDSDINKAQLEKLLGMDKLTEQVAKDMPKYDEVAE